MITSITNILITELSDQLVGIDVLREYPQTSPKLPCLIVTEGNLPVDISTMDSGGYHFVNYEITLDIYTEGSSKILKSSKIRKDIDDLLSGKYRLQRTFSSSIPNMIDTNVYRYRLTYSAKLDKNNTIYRG